MISTKAKELISSLIVDAAWSVGVTSPNLKSKTDLEGYIEELEQALKTLTDECLASDFNEHWDSYLEALQVLENK